MKKIVFVFFGFIFLFAAKAQNITFREQLPVAPQGIPMKADLYDIDNRVQVQFADLNNDGSLDIFLSGTFDNRYISRIFLNDGQGIFTESEDFQVNYTSGNAALVDMDNDGDIDIVFSYISYSGPAIYLNDGQAHFTEWPQNDFAGEEAFSVKATDLNGDGFTDLVFCEEYHHVHVYLNDGNLHFTLQDTPQLPSQPIVMDVVDVNNDNHMDLYIHYFSDSEHAHNKIFLNNGNASFTPQADIDSLFFTRHVFYDVNGDGYRDFLISGTYDRVHYPTHLYLNDGTGQFVRDTLQTLPSFHPYNFKFHDMDGDGDGDLVVTGLHQIRFPGGHTHEFSSLYVNDGMGHFSMDSSFKYVWKVADYVYDYNESLDIGDLNDDGKPEIIIANSVMDFTGSAHTLIFTKDQTGIYQPVTGSYFNCCFTYPYFGRMLDADNDGDLDVLYVGLPPYGSLHEQAGKLYLNDGNGHFGMETDSLDGIPMSIRKLLDLEQMDLDSDGDYDYILTTINPNTVYFYYNDGGNYTSVVPYNSGYTYGIYRFAFGNINGDSLTDMIAFYNDSIKFYINHLTHFTVTTDTTFGDPPNIRWLKLMDMDNDGDQDAVTIQNDMLKIYQNDGTGHFTILNGNIYECTEPYILDFYDINNDHIPDILISGDDNTVILQSSAPGQYIELTQTFPHAGTARFVDFDNDGHADIFLSNKHDFNDYEGITRIYRNNGRNRFSLVNDLPLPVMEKSVILIGDINGDDKKDLIFTGQSSVTCLSRIFLNETQLTAVDKHHLSSLFSIYPNPSGNQFKIKSSKPVTGSFHVAIYDMSGNRVKSYPTQDIYGQTFRHHLPKGIYIIEIESKENKQVHRLKLIVH